MDAKGSESGASFDPASIDQSSEMQHNAQASQQSAAKKMPVAAGVEEPFDDDIPF